MGGPDLAVADLIAPRRVPRQTLRPWPKMGGQPRERIPSAESRPAMKDFFLNVTRYPRYLVAFGLGVFQSVLDPLLQRLSNPVTAVALVGALISGLLSLVLVLRAMVNTAPSI